MNQCFFKIGDTVYPVYDPPEGLSETNWFTMVTGASRYGRGQFLMRRVDYDAMVAASTDGLATLTMSSDLSVGSSSNTLTLSVVLAGAMPASTGTGGDDQTAKDMVYVGVFDKRCRYGNPVNKAYNVQRDGFPLDGSNNPLFYASTLNSSSEWTWDQLLGDASLPLTPATVSWKPRNLIFDNVPKGKVLDEIAARLSCVVGFDYTNPVLFEPNVTSSDNDTTFAEAETSYFAGRETKRADNRLPGKFIVTFKAMDLDNPGDPYANRMYTKEQTTGHGQSAVTMALHVGEYIAIRSGSAWVNQSELDAVAASMATRKLASMTAEIGEWRYAGIWPFDLDGQVRGVKWISNRKGAQTIIRLNNDTEFDAISDIRRALDLSSNQLVIGLGASNVSMGQSGARMVWSGQVRGCFPVNLTVSDGVDGDNTMEPSYVYDVEDEDGNPIDSDVAPLWAARTIGSFSPATAGIGHRKSDGTFILDIAFETPAVSVDCAS